MYTILVALAFMLVPASGGLAGSEAPADPPAVILPARSDSPTITITREPLAPGRISPFQYGQFIEYLCALTPSMFAEKIFDGGFEGVPGYKVAFRKETDRLERPWYPDGATHRGEFALDREQPGNGKLSERVGQKPGDPCVIGISQAGKFVKAGESIRCRLSLRRPDWIARSGCCSGVMARRTLRPSSGRKKPGNDSRPRWFRPKRIMMLPSRFRFADRARSGSTRCRSCPTTMYSAGAAMWPLHSRP